MTILVRSRIICREQFWYVLELQNYLNNTRIEETKYNKTIGIVLYQPQSLA